MGVIGIRNLAGGVLSGGLDRAVADDSLVARDAQRAPRLAFLGREGATLSQVAMRFVLSQAAISTVVPGAKNVAEVEDAVAAAELPPLSKAELALLDEAAQDDFGVREPSPATL